MNFELHLTKSPEKDLTKLRGLAEEAVRRNSSAQAKPLLGPSAEGLSVGVRALESSLRRGVAYRAAYIVQEDDKTCLVFILGSRRFLSKGGARQRP